MAQREKVYQISWKLKELHLNVKNPQFMWERCVGCQRGNRVQRKDCRDRPLCFVHQM